MSVDVKERAESPRDYGDRLKKENWEARVVSLQTAQRITRDYHYARGGSNTRVYTHGLFHAGDFFEEQCQGITWWIPPTKSAALATYPQNWQGVLSLTRMVILPGVPKNACSFLLSRSMRFIDRDRWPCLVTYADEWQGHSGTIYKATNWTYVGMTKPQATWVKDGRMISRKAGPKTRTKAQMEALGCSILGKYRKHKYVHITE